MKLLLGNLPTSLASQRGTLAACLEAMNAELWGEARPDSDVDLCLVANGAERQLKTAQRFRRAMRPLRG